MNLLIDNVTLRSVNRRGLRAIVAVLVGMSSASFAETVDSPHPHSLSETDYLETHYAAGWDSRYYSEGRDALDGDPIAWWSAEAAHGIWAGGIWHGFSPEQNYDELQLWAGVSHSINNIAFSLAWRHLRFPFENSFDNEIGLGLTWDDFCGVCAFTADIYYSLEAEGWFSEFGWHRDILSTDRFALSLSGILGANQGYVTDGHDGLNHAALSAELAVPLSETVSFGAHLTHNWSLERNLSAAGDAQLFDFWFGGFGLEISF